MFVVLLAYGVPLPTLLRQISSKQWAWKKGNSKKAKAAMDYMRANTTWPSCGLERLKSRYERDLLESPNNVDVSPSTTQSVLKIVQEITDSANTTRAQAAEPAL